MSPGSRSSSWATRSSTVAKGDALGRQQCVADLQDALGRREAGALDLALLEADEVGDDDLAGEDAGVLVAECPQGDVLGDLRRGAHHLQADLPALVRLLAAELLERW